tara:strand:- start:2376 stop:3089 length:714 start_codon:yes stop_codon:yes gene_type:complete
MKKILSLVLILMTSCATFQPVDKCCETEVVYLDEVQGDSTNLFTSLEFNTITLDFRPLRPRFFYGHSYGYWHTRPLWLDFNYWHNDFYYSNFYSYYSYYYRPWNYWDWYMRPWRPANNWYQGPFNNPSYNVVYNASRRNSVSNLNRSIATAIANNRVENANNRPIINNKPIVVNNSYKPNNNYKPSNNNYISKPNYNYKPNNNYKPSSNSRATYNSSGSNNSYSRPSGSVSSSRKIN